MKKLDTYTIGEEVTNSVLHVLGAYISLIFSTIICYEAIIKGLSFINTVSLIIFGISMTLMYTMSSAYHCIQYIPAKKVLKFLDHSSIYAAIAGMCTPICLIVAIPDSPKTGWSLLIFQWLAVVVGTLIKYWTAGRYKYTSTIMYAVLGWSICVILGPLFNKFDINTLFFLISGGVVYTVGSIFYVLKSVPYSHSIWHLFVLIGSVLHFEFVYKMVDMM